MTVDTPRKPRFFYGWVIVAVSFVSDAVAIGAGNSSFSVFLKPMSESLGWSRTILTGSVTLQTVFSLLTNPFVGRIIDRHGPKMVMVFGAVIAGVCYRLVGNVTEPWEYYLLYAAATALGLHELGQLVTSAAVSKWFVRKRGRALAIAAIGSSVGQVVFAPLAAFLVVTVGWRDAWGVIGLIAVVVVVPPTLLFMRRTPEDMGLLPDGDPPDETSDITALGSSRPRDTAMGVRDALRTRTLWTLVIAFNLSSIAFSAIGYHLLPYYTDIGFSLQTASLLMALTQTIATFSKLPWGLIAEHVPVRYCLMVVVLGRVGGLLSLLLFTSPIRVFGFVFIAGSLTYVMGPLQSQIWADYYGRSFIGSIRGILAPFTLISSLVGPIFAAIIYDQFGSYEVAFWGFVVTLSLSAVAFFFAKPPSLVPTNQRP